MPKADFQEARRLASLSSDCSFLLTHLVRQNGSPARRNDEALHTLLSILGITPQGDPVLRAGKVGWYNKCSAKYFDPEQQRWVAANSSPSVCFTESTLAGLRAHREVFNAQYGIAFDRDWLFGRGANPCLNIRVDLLKQEVKVPGYDYVRHNFNFIPFGLQPFVNIVNESFDATHEREWRHVGDLQFSWTDILFIFAPETDFHALSSIQQSGRPVLFDLAWLDRV